MASTFLIIGAAGKTGRSTAETLLGRGHQVRALVRQEDERSEALARQGAEIVVGDVQDIESISAAARGIDALYFTYPIAPGLIDATANVAQAADENGVKAIVNMSQISARRDSESDAARHHWVAERVLDRFPVPATHLRPTFFGSWLVDTWADGTGELRLPFGEGRHAPIAETDQAAVIAAILENPAPHAGKVYSLYGPVERDHYGIAAEMSRALGREVTYVPIDLDDFTKILEGRGAPAHLVQHLRAVAIDYRNGVFAGTNGLVKEIGGVDPLDVYDFVTANKASFVTN
ncbi:NAD(P)H-binding protein [Streptomyces mirabilis]|uniref:NmrA family NAD(P)-binding protein n=1 Tax=Streptomyces mirabilis TaxID=68239 RepID=UPI0036B2E37F